MVSFNYILSSFNHVVQIYYVFVSELTDDPILHVKYVHFGYYDTQLMIQREMNNVAQTFEAIWGNSHGSTANVQVHIEFPKRFNKELNYFV